MVADIMCSEGLSGSLTCSHQRDLAVKFGLQICHTLEGADVEADTAAEQREERESW